MNYKLPLTFAISAALLVGLTSCNYKVEVGDDEKDKAAGATAATDESDRNKETVTQLLLAYEKGDTAALNNFIHADVKDNTAMDPSKKEEQNLKSMKGELAAFHTAFPDLKLTINHLVAEGDKVMVHTTTTGTNTAPLMDMPATNKSLKFDAVDVYQFRDGKVSGHWAVTDNLGFMVQMGLIPDLCSSRPQTPIHLQNRKTNRITG